MNLQNIKGIGEKTLESLYESNIYNLEELLTYFPYRYQILEPSSLENTNKDETLTINATVTDIGKVTFIRKNLNTYRFKVTAYGKFINVTIFNRAFIKPHITLNKEITLIGKYDAKKNLFTASDIKLSKIEGTKIIPIYHLIKGIKNNTLVKLISEGLKEASLIDDYVPDECNQKYKLCSKKDALSFIHQPNNQTENNLLSSVTISKIPTGF